MSEYINNRENRIRVMKDVILHLHRGGAPDEVRALLRDLVRETDAAEIAAMEQSLIADDGMTVDEVRSMCDLHSQVLRDVMVQRQSVAAEPGHPVHTFRKENAALGERVDALRAVHCEVLEAAPDEPLAKEVLGRWRALVDELTDVDKHYRRKEELLFTFLEAHGISGPSKVMWAKDDEVRAKLRDLRATLVENPATAAEWVFVVHALGEPAADAVAEMIFKEENILLPLSLNTLTEQEWAQVYEDSPRFGWCLVEPDAGYRPAAPTKPAHEHDWPAGEAVAFPTGHLAFEHLLGIFRTLPVDITFVDADDRVRFFSESKDRVFTRSKSIIGRKVHNCHPPASVHVVERIVNDFKTGAQDTAEFWIEFRGRFVHIQYFAVRDEAGAYLGTLEVTQDATHLRALTGERRLLAYDAPEAS